MFPFYDVFVLDAGHHFKTTESFYTLLYIVLRKANILHLNLMFYDPLIITVIQSSKRKIKVNVDFGDV